MDNRIHRCIYCGSDEAITRDHVIPVAYTAKGRCYDEGDVVPCCTECNLLLSDRPLFTVEDRANYLSDALTQKHRDVMRTEEFDEDELEEMDKNLRSYIEANLFMKEWVRSRISHCLSVAYGNYDAPNLRTNGTVDKNLAYQLLNAAMYNDVKSYAGSIKEAAKDFQMDPKDAKRYIEGKEYESVRIGFMYDHNVPFETPVTRMKAILYSRTH